MKIIFRIVLVWASSRWKWIWGIYISFSFDYD